MPVDGKVVIVTGGAAGVGRYVAGTFAAAGARLAIADVAPMDTVREELSAAGAEVLTIPTDVRLEDDVEALMEQAHNHYGRIDVLLNNAAVVTHFPGGGKPAWPRIRDMEEDFFDLVLRTNVAGVFLCTKHAIPYMKAQGAGHIISVGQGTLKPSTRTDNIGSAIYSMTKVAVRSFVANMAAEERDSNICIVSMGPGGGGAPGLRGIWTEDIDEKYRAGMAPTETIGNRYVLAADAPMELTGHQLTVADGRLTIAADG